MKRLAHELHKNYKLLIVIFILPYITFLLFFASYIKKVSFDDIYSVDSFLSYELTEFKEEIVSKEKTVDQFFYEALEECPDVPGVTVFFKFNNKIYSDDKVLENFYKFEKKKFSNEIQKIDFYKYHFLKKIVSAEDFGNIEVLIVKNLIDDRLLLFNVIIVSTILITIAFLISIFVSKKFYNEVVTSINNLQKITNNINLNNINPQIKSKNYFIEIEKVMLSYENMLERLYTQTNAQIEFVNNASHELKTPLFIIKGYLNLIERWGIEKKDISLEALVSIKEEVENMDTLIKKLLFLAKDDNENLEYIELDISEVISNIISELKVVYPKQKISFNGSENYINSDYFLIKQLFFNIIENAIKYGNNNEINVSIVNNKNISIIIEDNGIGISKENLNHIYDRFFRVDKSRNREIKSHGLGLSIVKKITRILKIDLNIESEINKGTKVTVTIPTTKI
ncbi:sensor histidine kinase [Fusobacterium perfoetens]|uniref:sensor histidine kinase n=1 Tax=Fusobacterium perfoetens TaxID=852 RepID=UPI0004890620|nr:HAMP domain-containing sensor histidine kinase [Fusobacterium perfoetens]